MRERPIGIDTRTEFAVLETKIKTSLYTFNAPARDMDAFMTLTEISAKSGDGDELELELREQGLMRT